MCPHGRNVAVTCRITLNHPCTRRGALWQITLTTCYLSTRPFTQSHRQARDSSRVMYCGHFTQYSHLVNIWNSLPNTVVYVVCRFCMPDRNRRTTIHQFTISVYRIVFGRPFVKRFVLCNQTVVCLSVCLSVLSVCLPVTFVYCRQTVGRSQMKLGMQACLGPGHMLDGVSPIFGP